MLSWTSLFLDNVSSANARWTGEPTSILLLNGVHSWAYSKFSFILSPELPEYWANLDDEWSLPRFVYSHYIKFFFRNFILLKRNFVIIPDGQNTLIYSITFLLQNISCTSVCVTLKYTETFLDSFQSLSNLRYSLPYMESEGSSSFDVSNKPATCIYSAKCLQQATYPQWA